MPPAKDDAPKADLRVIRTRRLLSAALVELTLREGFENVTIRALTDAAGIGYATFFRHYPSKERLLEALLEEVLAELMTRLEPLSAATNPIETGTQVFEHVGANRDLYRVLLKTQHVLDLMPRALELGMNGVRRTFSEKADGLVPLELAAHHIIRSIIGLIEWWLEQDTPAPPERMGRIFHALIMQPTRDLALEVRLEGGL